MGVTSTAFNLQHEAELSRNRNARVASRKGKRPIMAPITRSSLLQPQIRTAVSVSRLNCSPPTEFRSGTQILLFRGMGLWRIYVLYGRKDVNPKCASAPKAQSEILCIYLQALIMRTSPFVPTHSLLPERNTLIQSTLFQSLLTRQVHGEQHAPWPFEIQDAAATAKLVVL